MTLLVKNPDTGWFTDTTVEGITLTNVHPVSACATKGCAIHAHPSDHPLKDAPLNWRSDRGILERICEHGVGHPDWDSAIFLESIGKGVENIHGCDGCCTPEN